MNRLQYNFNNILIFKKKQNIESISYQLTASTCHLIIDQWDKTPVKYWTCGSTAWAIGAPTNPGSYISHNATRLRLTLRLLCQVKCFCLLTPQLWFMTPMHHKSASYKLKLRLPWGYHSGIIRVHHVGHSYFECLLLTDELIISVGIFKLFLRFLQPSRSHVPIWALL